MAAEKITSFTKLIAWQKAHQLVVKIYTTTTSFPPHEIHSLTELQNQLLIARDIGYLPVEKFRDLAEQTIEIGKILGGLKRSVKLTPN